MLFKKHFQGCTMILQVGELKSNFIKDLQLNCEIKLFLDTTRGGLAIWAIGPPLPQNTVRGPNNYRCPGAQSGASPPLDTTDITDIITYIKWVDRHVILTVHIEKDDSIVIVIGRVITCFAIDNHCHHEGYDIVTSQVMPQYLLWEHISIVQLPLICTLSHA